MNSHETNIKLKTLYTPGVHLYDSQIIAVSICSYMIFHDPEEGIRMLGS